MLNTVIVPVKSFTLGKRRLSSTLDPATRARLGRHLADHVAVTIAAAGLIPLIVTADAGVAEWATRSGYPSLPDPEDGLDAAVSVGVDWSRQSGETWLALHSDLPLLEAADVEALTRTLAARTSVIAPSSDGGTSALGGREPIDFSYGAASFHRHLPRLTDPGVVSRTGLLHDLDSPTDLVSVAATVGGAWIAELIGPLPGI